MLAPILLSDYKMKKNKELAAKRESETPVTLEFMREMRDEMRSGFAGINARFTQVDAKFDQVNARIDQLEARFDQVDAQFEQVNARTDEVSARVDQAVAEMKTMNHQTKLLVEEQALRNRQAYDGYAIAYGAIEDLKNRIKPECLED